MSGPRLGSVDGADARRADTRGNTPLHHAARCAEPIIAALLIDASADPDAVNADGATPLAVACEGGKWSIAAFMLEHPVIAGGAEAR